MENISLVRFNVLRDLKYTDGQRTHNLWEVLCPKTFGYAGFVCQNGVKSVRTAWPVLTLFLAKLVLSRWSLQFNVKSWVPSPALRERAIHHCRIILPLSWKEGLFSVKHFSLLMYFTYFLNVHVQTAAQCNYIWHAS